MIASRRWARWLVAMALGLVAGGSTAVRLADVADDDSIEITRDPRLQLVAPAEALPGLRIFQLSAGQLSGNLDLDARVVSRHSTITLVEFFDAGNTLLGTGTLQSGGTNRDGVYRYTWLNRPLGSSSFRIRATNAAGQKESIGPLTIIVNRPPTVTLTAPSAASTVVTAPTSIALSATTSEDAGDAVTQVQFLRKPSGAPVTSYTVIQTITATAGQNVFNGSWSVDNTNGGVYDVTARATDSFLGSNDAASKSVTVCASVSPTITGPTASQVFQLGSTGGTTSVTLTATVTVPANCSLPSSLSFYSGTSVTAGTLIAGAPTATTAGQTRTFTQTWSSLGGGVYNVAARANYGTTTADTSTPVSFRVNRPPSAVSITTPLSQAVFAVPGYGQTVAIPVTLTATENLDAGDGITKLEVFLDGSATASATQTFPPTAGVQTTSGMSIAGVGYVTGTTTGARSLTARATDNFGGTLNTASATPIRVGYALSANNSTLPHGGFETPRLSTTNALVVRPTGSAWTFTGEAGMRANTTGLVAPEPNPPVAGQTSQMGYLRCGTGLTSGAMTQVVVPQAFTQGSPTRPYKLKLKGAYDSTGAQQIKVTVTDLVAATSFSEVLTPTSSSAFIQLTTAGTFDLTAGKAYALKLEPNTCTATRIAYVDDVQLEVQNAPATVVMVPGSVPTRIQLLNPTTQSITPQATVGDPDNPSGTVYVGFFYQQTAPSGPETRIGTADVAVTLSAGSATVTGIAWTPTAGGTYDVYAKASDAVQPTPTVASPKSSVVVNAPPNAPTLNVTAPAAGAAAVIKGANVTVSATATDPNGTPDVQSLRFVRPGSADVVTTTTTGTATANYAAIAGTAPSTATTATTGAEAAQTTTFTAYAKDADGREGPASNAVNLLICKEPDITVTGPGTGGTTTTRPKVVVASGASASVPIAAAATTGNAGCGTIQSFTVALVTVAANGTVTESSIAPTSPPPVATTTALSTAAQTFAAGQTHTLRFRATSNAQSSLITARTQTFDYLFDVVVNSPPSISSLSVQSVTGNVATIRVAASDPDAQNTLTASAAGAAACAIAGGTCDLSVPVGVGVTPVTVTVTDPYGATASAVVMAGNNAAPDAVLRNPADQAEIANPDTSTVGTTAGTFAVGEGGAATYSISIQAPPGVNGLQPALSLSYSSQGGNGYLGVGWSLGGVSSITRCQKTIATDGIRLPINYDSVVDPTVAGNDAFCLDGQRLIPIAGTTTTVPCTLISSGTCYAWEFRTEVESYSRILAIGGTSNYSLADLGSGPTRFRVWTKSGQILEFGSRWWPMARPRTTGTDPAQDSVQVLKAWPLDRVEDVFGNYMHIDYGGSHADDTLVAAFGAASPALGTARTTGGPRPVVELYPRRLTYGMRSGASDSVISRVILNYESGTRTDVEQGFDSGSGQGRVSKRLSSIVTTVGGFDDTSTDADRAAFHNAEISGGNPATTCMTGSESTPCGDVVRSYRFQYGTSPDTGRALLTSVTECDGSAKTKCLPPTNFAWQNNAALSLNGTGSADQGVSGLPFADWNFLGEKAKIADVVGDGRSRLVRYKNSTTLSVCTHNGAAVNGAFTCSDWTWASCAIAGQCSIPDNLGLWTLADYDGDGRPDLVVQTGEDKAFACPSTGTGFGTCVAIPDAVSDVRTGSHPKTRYFQRQADVNGDGRIDILFYRGNGYWEVCLAPFTSGTCQHILTSGLPINDGVIYGQVASGDFRNHILFGDFNGDGRADFIRRVPTACKDNTLFGTVCPATATDSDPYWSVCFFEGPDNNLQLNCATASLAAPNGGTGAGPDKPVLGISGKISKLAAIDLNGDGLADFAAPNVVGSVIAGWTVCLSAGDGEFIRTTQTDRASPCPVWAGPTGTVAATSFGDFNGDGRTDLLTYNTATSQWQVCLSTGTRFDCRILTGTQPRAPAVDGQGNAEIFAGDFNGDGRTDVAINASGLSGTILSIGLAAGVIPDLLTSITTGLGATTTVTYAPLTSPAVYARGPAVTTTDEFAMQSPMVVVKSVTASDGIGGTFGSSYFYEGMRGGTNGRGLLGFAKRRTIDGLGIVTETTYNNTASPSWGTPTTAGSDWALAGRPIKVTKWAPTSTNYTAPDISISPETTAYAGYQLVNRVTSDWRSRASLAGYSRVVETHNIGTLEESWELGGTPPVALPTNTTSTPFSSVDQYGSVSASTVSSSDGFSKATTNTYHPAYTTGVNGWIVGRLFESTVTHNGGTGSVTRRSRFTYHGIGTTPGSCGTALGVLCTEEVEPQAGVTDSNGQGTAADRDLYLRTTYAYDAYGNRTNTYVSFYDRDIDGVLSTSLLSPPRTSTVTYGSGGRYPVLLTNAAGHAERREIDPRFGTVTKVIGPNNLLSETIFDGFGRKIREKSYSSFTETAQSGIVGAGVVSDAIWTTTATAVCGSNGVYTTTRTVAGAPQAQVTYDSLQREVCSQSVNFSGGWTVAEVNYDTYGRKVKTTKKVATGTVTSRVEYDSLNRPVCEYSTTSGTPAASCTAAVASTTGGTLTRSTTTYSGLKTTTTVYGANGGVTTSNNSLTTERTKNSQGWVTLVRDASGNDTAYGYNAIGNLTSVAAPGNYAESFSYDARGRKTGMNSNDAGNNWVYKYNGAGEMGEQTDARGWVSRTVYDALGRPTARREYENTGNGSYFGTTTTYDNCVTGDKAKGKVCTVVSGYDGTPRTRSELRYDALGRPSSSVTMIDGKVFSSATAYDKLGRAYEQGAPGGIVFTTGYQTSGGQYATTVTQKDTGTVHWQANSRNDDGSIATMTVGGLTTSKTYDGHGRISGISTGASGAIQNAAFGFDALGNLVSRSDTSNGITSATFTYDALNRLTDWTADFTGSTGSARYDAAGNIVWKSGLVGCTGTPSASTPCLSYVSATHRLQTGNGATYTYESGSAAGVGNGNVNTIGGKTLSGYTSFNLPTSATYGTARLDWLYDGSHIRIREVSSVHGTTYFMGAYERVERDRITVTLADSATPYTGCLEERTYITTPEGTVGVVTRRTGCAGNSSGALGDPSYWHKDHIGSIVAITSASGAATARFRFDPWGARQCATLNGSGVATAWVSCNASSNEERGFTGHEMLDELGLVHMNGRLYDQSVGRFLQADPIVQDAYNAQNYNRYSYVMNNPLSYTDPTGFSWWTKWRRTIFATVAAIAVPMIAGNVFLELGMFESFEGASAFVGTGAQTSTLLSTTGNAVAASAGGFAAGGISGGNLQSAVNGAVTAALTFGVGEASGAHAPGGTAGMTTAQRVGQIAGHAAVGCASHAAAGGSCRAGAMSAGFSALVGPHLPGGDVRGFSASNLLSRMAVGAIASKLGGGKAESGALSAAFEYLYNDAAATGQEQSGRSGGGVIVPTTSDGFAAIGRAIDKAIADTVDSIVYAVDYRKRALRAEGIDPASTLAASLQVHHVVQWGHPGAAIARANLALVGIGVNDLENLLVTPTYMHQSGDLHTPQYRTAVNEATSLAVAGGYKTMVATLSLIKAAILTKGSFP